MHMFYLHTFCTCKLYLGLPSCWKLIASNKIDADPMFPTFPVRVCESRPGASGFTELRPRSMGRHQVSSACVCAFFRDSPPHPPPVQISRLISSTELVKSTITIAFTVAVLVTLLTTVGQIKWLIW